MPKLKRLLFIVLLVVFACEYNEKDCAGVEGGNNICGCTASTALNYDSTATFDCTSSNDMGHIWLNLK